MLKVTTRAGEVRSERLWERGLALGTGKTLSAAAAQIPAGLVDVLVAGRKKKKS